MKKNLIATFKVLEELGFNFLYFPSLESSQSKPNKEKALEELFKKNKECCKCSLCQSRNQIVFYDGNPYSPVVFVGEAPGEEEDKQGKPFVGRAGQLLTRILQKIGWDRKDIYITNICKCRPPNNRTPKPEEIQTCINTFLIKELKIVKPKVICALGATAGKTLLGKNIKITKMRGNFYSSLIYPSAKIFLTFHPSYILRNPSATKIFLEDLKKLKEYVNSISC